MSPTIDKAIRNAAASAEIEGYHISEKCKALCEKLMNNEISLQQYIELVCSDSDGEI